MEYILYWLDGTKNKIEDDSFGDAFNKYYSSGALRALAFYVESKDGFPDDIYEWYEYGRRWVLKETDNDSD